MWFFHRLMSWCAAALTGYRHDALQLPRATVTMRCSSHGLLSWCAAATHDVKSVNRITTRTIAAGKLLWRWFTKPLMNWWQSVFLTHIGPCINTNRTQQTTVSCTYVRTYARTHTHTHTHTHTPAGRGLPLGRCAVMCDPSYAEGQTYKPALCRSM